MTDFCLFSLTLQAALETLLLRKPVRLKCHPLANYHYAGRSPGTLCPVAKIGQLTRLAMCYFLTNR